VRVINLHDATLVSIVMQWSEGVVELSFRTVDDGLVALRAVGVSYVEVPRRRPWGPSVSVLEMTGPDEVAEGRQITLTMQTGDELVIIAETIELST
jgi:hypothetical protein